MKKNLIASLLCALLISSASYARDRDAGYAGADIILTTADHRHDDNNVRLGLGIDLGYRKNFDRVFLAPEVFYDQFDSSNSKTLQFNGRYGAKLNLGYDFDQNISGYLTYGLANLRYQLNSSTDTQNKFTSIYGLGLLFKINRNWDAKAEYTQQRFDTPYSLGTVKLNVLKVGVLYYF